MLRTGARAVELVAIAMMARAPSAPGKSRLAPGVSRARHAALRAALFDDTFAVLRRVKHTKVTVFYTPAGGGDDVRARVPNDVSVAPQTRGDLGARMKAACRRLLNGGASGVVLIGSDLPDLPCAVVTQAVAALRAGRNRLVVGPATDGGYYLLGLGRCHVSLFRGIAWGSSHVLAQTLARAEQLGLDVVQLAPWTDVDTDADLGRIAVSRGAPQTRAWLAGRRVDVRHRR